MLRKGFTAKPAVTILVFYEPFRTSDDESYQTTPERKEVILAKKLPSPDLPTVIT